MLEIGIRCGRTSRKVAGVVKCSRRRKTSDAQGSRRRKTFAVAGELGFGKRSRLQFAVRALAARAPFGTAATASVGV
jgi:hypothetical protein